MKELLDDLNGLNELIYLADPETYELLFVNDRGLVSFGYHHRSEILGKKCYQILQGLNSPCSFCTNSSLSQGTFMEWEFTNPLTKCHYLLKDTLVQYEGRLVRMEIALDVTRTVKERLLLENALDNERFILECIKMLHSDIDLGIAITNTLKLMGESLKSDRTYIFEFSDGMMDNTYEWCDSGIVPEINELKGLPIKEINRWLSIFAQNKSVIIEDLEVLKDTDPAEYHRLNDQHIHSLITVPLISGGQITGFFGVDNPPPERLNNISDILKILAYFFRSLLASRQLHERMKFLSFSDSLTGARNRNAYIRDISAAESSPIHHYGVVFVDVNGLKHTNDHYGHFAGDELLIRVYNRIISVFHQFPIYRTGGDEFVLLCDRIEENPFLQKAQQLKDLFVSDSKSSAAIGAAWTPYTDNFQRLVNQAESRMYEDKKRYYDSNHNIIQKLYPEPVQAETDLSDNGQDQLKIRGICEDILYLCCCRKDMDAAMAYTASSFVFIDERCSQLYDRSDTAAFLGQQVQLYQEASIYNVSLDIRRLSHDTWLCCDRSTLVCKADERCRMISLMNSLLFQKQGDTFRCLSIHSSFH